MHTGVEFLPSARILGAENDPLRRAFDVGDNPGGAGALDVIGEGLGRGQPIFAVHGAGADQCLGQARMSPANSCTKSSGKPLPVSS